jgi:hypothetical protein
VESSGVADGSIVLGACDAADLPAKGSKMCLSAAELNDLVTSGSMQLGGELTGHIYVSGSVSTGVTWSDLSLIVDLSASSSIRVLSGSSLSVSGASAFSMSARDDVILSASTSAVSVSGVTGSTTVRADSDCDGAGELMLAGTLSGVMSLYGADIALSGLLSSAGHVLTLGVCADVSMVIGGSSSLSHGAGVYVLDESELSLVQASRLYFQTADVSVSGTISVFETDAGERSNHEGERTENFGPHVRRNLGAEAGGIRSPQTALG